MGFVGLASASPLVEQANGAIDAMLKDGEVAALAAPAAQMTYLPPRQPYILDHLTMQVISLTANSANRERATAKWCMGV